jgi:hypothetical protein
MNPQEEIKELKETVATLMERVEELKVMVSPDREIFFDNKLVTDDDVTISTAIGAGGGTVNHLDFPDRWLVKRQGTKVYLVPAYNFTRL